ncbi:SRPBCC family protein [Natribaculum luteum]|uniref:SRPBCC family protein n=1 Tax=Natribaculum luteum TaxID=1586232 RepID=A0ABD5P5U2_9EURY|nr:SRPBCC family protein [Natribaculum luteum]
MQTVESSRFVRAPPDAVDRHLTPETIVEYEGSFTVRDVREREDDWLVTAGTATLELTFRFERLDNGFYYEQEGEEGPLEVMETTLTCEPEDEGTRVTVQSTVHMGLWPAALTDRIAAWKRRSELERALERLAADLE